MQRGEVSTLAASPNSARERSAGSEMFAKAAGGRNPSAACGRATPAGRLAAASSAQAKSVGRMLGMMGSRFAPAPTRERQERSDAWGGTSGRPAGVSAAGGGEKISPGLGGGGGEAGALDPPHGGAGQRLDNPAGAAGFLAPQQFFKIIFRPESRGRTRRLPPF